jgi:hypothetical protein
MFSFFFPKFLSFSVCPSSSTSSFSNKSFNLSSLFDLILQPVDYIMEKFYNVEVHSRHQKLAADANYVSCTPSAFLNKPRERQIRTLSIDLLIHVVNLSIIATSVVGANFDLFTVCYAYFGIDFMTGIFHLMLDNPVTKVHPISIVQNLAWQFQDHHDKPYDTTLPPLFHTLSNLNALLTIPLLCCKIYGSYFSINMFSLSLSTYLFATMSQWVHRNIHYVASQRTTLFNLLQCFQLVQNTEAHHKHHKTYDCHYATLSGWTDSVLHFLMKNVSAFRYNNPYWFSYCMFTFVFLYPLSYIALYKLLFI